MPKEKKTENHEEEIRNTGGTGTRATSIDENSRTNKEFANNTGMNANSTIEGIELQVSRQTLWTCITK